MSFKKESTIGALAVTIKFHRQKTLVLSVPTDVSDRKKPQMDKLAIEASPHSGVDFIKFQEILRVLSA